MHHKSLYAFIVLSLCSLSPSRVCAQISEPISTNSLLGVTGVAVSIGEVSPALQAAGVNTEQLRADAVSKLKTAGISIIPETGWLDSAGGAELYLEVNSLKFGAAQYCFSIQLNVIQKVVLSRDQTRATLGITRSASAMGAAGETKVAGAVREQAGTELDQFIVRYVSANRPARK
jgi:hypothetical protein